jgi:hypothetical protein
MGGWGDKIKESGYGCTRPLAIFYLEIPVAGPGVGQQIGRTGYIRTDEAAEGMKKHGFRCLNIVVNLWPRESRRI